jgi:hypothetical protein
MMPFVPHKPFRVFFLSQGTEVLSSDNWLKINQRHMRVPVKPFSSFSPSSKVTLFLS